MHFDLTLSYNTWLLILAVVMLAGLSVWVYRATTPKVSEVLRKLLLVLRFFSIVMVLFLIFEPVLGLSWRHVEKAVVTLLIDDSSSLQLGKAGSARAQEMRKLLSEPWLQTLNEKYEIVPIVFSDKAALRQMSALDSLRFDGDGTNIRTAIDYAAEQVSGKNFSGMLLLSDGAQNIGGDPVTGAVQQGVPVYAIGVGSEKPEKDSWIAEILTNEIAYADTKVPVEAIVRATGLAGQSAQVSLKQSGKTVAVETVQLPQDFVESKVRFDFVPERAGVQKYELLLTTQDGEMTDRNNSRSFYMNVLKSKLQIVIVAGAPDAEITFLKHVLGKDENLTVSSYVALGASGRLSATLPQLTELSELDCIIAVSMPSNRNAALDQWLRQAVLEKHIPMLFLTGPVQRAADLWRYRDLLPLANIPRSVNEKAISATPSPQGLIHPVLRFRENSLEVRAALQELPPLFSTLARLQLLPTAQTLLYGVPAQNSPIAPAEAAGEPVLVAQRQGELNTITLFAASLWRWHLMMQKVELDHNVYEKLVVNSVRWLVSASDARQMQVSTDKDIYRAGEEVVISAQAYFEDFTPRDNLELSVRLSNGSAVDEIVLEGQGRGLYEGRYHALTDGEYRLAATAKEGQAIIDTAESKFSVEALKIEYLQTAANLELLRNLAERTGGAYLHRDSLAQWADTLHFDERILVQDRSIQLWNRWPFLAVIVLALSLEWLIRKREGML